MIDFIYARKVNIRRKGLAALAAPLLIGALATGCGQHDGQTSCRDFLEQAKSERASTIAKMARDNGDRRSKREIEAEVVAYCTTGRNHVAGDSIDTIYSP